MRNKLFTLLFAVLASVGMMKAAIYSGTCGSNMTWQVNTSTGVLIISGNGEMANYTNTYSSYTPWYSYRTYIRSISIGEEVASIGNYAFSGFSNLTSISLPNGVERIGTCAFQNCTQLNTAFLGVGCSDIGNSAFSGCSQLSAISIPGDISSFGTNVFGGCTALTDPIYSTKQFFFMPFTFTGEYSIPSGIVEICASAFASCTNLTQITIPNSVQKIGVAAFSNCTALVAAYFGNGIKEIGASAFSNCSNLTTCDLSTGIETIGANAFSGCAKLSSPIYTTTSFIFMPTSFEGKYTMPQGIEKIEDSAFKNCSELTEIILPNSLSEIGSYAFNGCKKLIEIIIPENVKIINEYTFSECYNLQSIDLRNITEIKTGALNGCSSLQSLTISPKLTKVAQYGVLSGESFKAIYYEGTLEEWCKHSYYGLTSGLVRWKSDYDGYSVGDLYIQGQKLINAVIPNNIDTIHEGAFCGMQSIRNITIGSNVKNIESNAICHLPNITTIIVPDKVEGINWGNFSYCENLAHITFGENLQYIHNDNFLYQVPSLTSIEWRVKRLDYMYWSNDSLTSIQFGDKVEVIPSYFLQNQKLITSIELPQSVKAIGNYAFGNCIGLKNITLYEGLDSIGEQAFSGDTSLLTIQLPKSLTYIAPSAFMGCSNLDFITIPGGVKNISNDVFSGCTSLHTLYLGNGVQTISSRAFSTCTALDSITIPASITSIAEKAFIACTNLREVRWNAKNCADFSSSSVVPFTNSQITHFSLGDSVLRIPSYLCYNMTNIDTLHLPNTLTSIGTHAFDGCVGLKHLTIPDKVATIESYAFRYCTGLTTLDLGRRVKTIEQYALYQCKNITRITSRAALPPVVETNNTGIDKSTCTLYVPEQGLQAYKESEWWSEFSNIQGFEDPNYECLIAFGTCGENLTWELSCDSVLTISGTGEMSNWQGWGDYAPWYEYRGLLKKVVVEKGVTTIGNNAFAGSNIIVASLPNGLTTIGYGAFYGCDKLQTVNIPSTVTSIGSASFALWGDLPTVDNLRYADTYLVGATTSDVSAAIIQDGTKWIGDSAFCQSGYALTTLSIPSSVEHIGWLGCYNLNTIVNHATTPQVVSSYFYGNKSSCSLYVPAQSIDAYRQATGWKDFSKILPIDSVDSLYRYVKIGEFYYDLYELSSTAEVVCEVYENGDIYYVNYEHLKTAIIPSQITFNNKQYTVTSIGDGAFGGCDSLTYVYIPNTINRIHTYAFSNCYNLDSIVVEEGNPRYDGRDNSNAIIETATNKLIVGSNKTIIPESVTRIGDGAFRGRRFTSFVIPENVDSIGYEAFWFCSDLKSFTNYAKIPQTSNGVNHIFYFIKTSGCTLYVPAESIELYRAAAEWKDFPYILPIPGTEVECQPISGTCGENVTWELSCDSVLTIASSDGSIRKMGSLNLGDYKPFVAHVVVGENIISTGADAFWGCSNLLTVQLPSTLDVIGDNSFDGCSSLSSIELPEGVVTIGVCAFRGCSSLNSIELPSSLIRIYEDGFYNCSSLSSVTCKALTPPTLSNAKSGVFYGVDKSIPLYVPGPSIDLYKSADQWKDFMNILPIPGTEVEEPIFRVTFLNWNGDSIAEQLVAYNHAAEAPELPAREDYIFKGWTADIEHIVARTFAIALYDKVGVEVTYKAEDGDVIYSEHADLHIPEAPSVAGKTFAGWLTENIDKNGIVLRATYTIDNPTTNDDVTVVPGSNSANVTFPFVTGAITYVLVIRDLFGRVVCKIMFNASGRLLGIAFAPGRERQQSPQTDNFQFTVEGLDPSTEYEYEFVAHDETDEVIETLTGSFVTTAQDWTEDIESTQPSGISAQKVVVSDQVLILRGEKVYTVTGQEVR